MNRALELENQLVEEAKVNPERFALLYDKYFEQIYRYVMRRVNDVDTAQDLVSQSFFDALSHIKSYTFKGYPFSAWLYKIAHNNVLKWYRENGKYQKVDIEEIAELKGGDDVEGELNVLQDRSGVRELMERLEYEDRELIRLKYFEEASNIEIGDIMGITANNVGVKLYRALKRLKQLMIN